MVKRDVLFRVKKDGRLGIRYARLVNVALLGKLSWRVFNNEEALWVSVLKRKYVSMQSYLLIQIIWILLFGKVSFEVLQKFKVSAIGE